MKFRIPEKPVAAAVAALIIIGLLVHGYALTIPFFDNDDYMVENMFLYSLVHMTGGNYLHYMLAVYAETRIVIGLYPSFTTFFTLFEPSHQLLHAGPLAYHLIATILLFLLSLRFTENRRMSFVAALLFMLMPISAETTGVYSKFCHAQSCALNLLTLLLYFRYRETGRKTLYAASLFFATWSALSFEYGLMLPLLIASVELLWFPGQWSLRKKLVMFAPYLIPIIIWLSLANFVKPDGRIIGEPYQGTNLAVFLAPYTSGRFLLSTFVHLPTTFGWPIRGNMVPHWTELRWIGVMIWVALFAVFRRRIFTERRFFLFGLLYAAIMFVPVQRDFTYEPDLNGVRLLYNTTAGFAIMVAAAIGKSRARIIAPLVLLLAAGTVANLISIKREAIAFSAQHRQIVAWAKGLTDADHIFAVNSNTDGVAMSMNIHRTTGYTPIGIEETRLVGAEQPRLPNERCYPFTEDTALFWMQQNGLFAYTLGINDGNRRNDAPPIVSVPENLSVEQCRKSEACRLCGRFLTDSYEVQFF